MKNYVGYSSTRIELPRLLFERNLFNVSWFMFNSRRQPLNGYYLGALFYDSKRSIGFLNVFVLTEVLFVQAAF